MPLQTQAFSNILKILPPKNENFQKKKSDIFHISAQNIYYGYSLDPPRRGGSNEYPQSMYLNRNKKNNVYPCKPQFYYIKSQHYIGMFSRWYKYLSKRMKAWHCLAKRHIEKKLCNMVGLRKMNDNKS